MTSTSSGMNVYVAAAGHSFVSQSGLVAVLKAVRKHGLPDAISRPTLKRRRADAIPQETPVGPLWPAFNYSVKATACCSFLFAIPMPCSMLGKGAFEDLEKALGLTFSAEGALYDENFMNSIPGAVSMTSYDWMHIYLVSGLWNSEVSLLLDVLNKEHGMGAPALANFLKTVTWPKKVSSKGTTGIKVVEKHKEGHLSCSASEGLSLYPSVRCFLQTKVPQSIAESAAFKAVRSYYCLAAVLDLLVKTRKGAVSPDELQQSIEAHMTARLDAYKVVLSQYLELQEWERRGGIELIDAKEASVDMTNGLKQTLGLTLDPSVSVATLFPFFYKTVAPPVRHTECSKAPSVNIVQVLQIDRLISSRSFGKTPARVSTRQLFQQRFDIGWHFRNDVSGVAFSCGISNEIMRLLHLRSEKLVYHFDQCKVPNSHADAFDRKGGPGAFSLAREAVPQLGLLELVAPLLK
ncbi:unnamed protein product [Cladocopium goreaui]|uniref:Uncharacterized protein n=1 Tax=Cladocopium goreaui TaxID=2562237 RepID=A0A9P1FVM4_9DINO|nr:unnamed protein product [Cladocopium goreaui]